MCAFSNFMLSRISMPMHKVRHTRPAARCKAATECAGKKAKKIQNALLHILAALCDGFELLVKQAPLNNLQTTSTARWLLCMVQEENRILLTEPLRNGRHRTLLILSYRVVRSSAKNGWQTSACRRETSHLNVSV
ncbi:UNVERIFIED_CONTAM: hypothetical protein HHA_248280 [Hammondia hammondi]|eukprot:XP_008883844.1 hypothetical protein HHA_248280 [Hammondia hammondi]